MRAIDKPVYEGRFVYEFYEYCPGGDLRTALLLEHGNDTAEKVRDAVGEALLYLHEAQGGLVHRDVKPDNILRRFDGSWVLGDLELVTHLGDETELMARSNAERGTYQYMAPEQGTSPKCDWYSFGITLIETITGQHPYSRVLGLNQLPTTWAEVSEAQMHPVSELLGGLDSVQLTDQQRERWRLLLRGLLLRLPDQRWGDDQVREFLRGGTPETVVQEESMKPSFGTFLTPDELGAALAQDWDLARSTLASRYRYRDFEGPFLDALGLWLRDCEWPRQLPPHFNEIGPEMGQTNPDVAVAWVLKTLAQPGDPLSIPVPGHQPIVADPPGLAGLVTHAQEEGFDATGHYTMAIENLFATRLLYHLSRDENDPLRLIDVWWQWGFSRYEQLRPWAIQMAQADRARVRADNIAVLGSPGEHLAVFAQDAWELDGEDGADESRRARVLLLQSLVDQSTSSRMLHAIRDEHSDANKLEWFADLVSAKPAMIPRTSRRESPAPYPTTRRPVGRFFDPVRRVFARARRRSSTTEPSKENHDQHLSTL